MNKQVSAIIVLVGIIAVIYAGVRLLNKQTKARTEKKQKAAFEHRVIALEVACDQCRAVSPMEVLHDQRRKFQVCPECGAKQARPIVYYVCSNPECNQQLVRFANHVFEGREFHQSPEGGVQCPSCGRADTVEPREISINHAKETAEETGQDFPYASD